MTKIIDNCSKLFLQIKRTPQWTNFGDKVSTWNLGRGKILKIVISDFFKGLPDEVLLVIFSFLQHKPTLVKLMLISRRFNRIA